MIKDIFNDLIFKGEDWAESLLAWFILLLFAGIALFTVDILCGVSETEYGAVVGKGYSPASTGTGTGIGTNGQVTFITTSTSEEFKLVVKSTSAVYSASSDAYSWAVAEPGTPVRIQKSYGCITHALYGVSAWVSQ